MEETAGGMQALAGEICTDMVIEQAIKDKIARVEKDMMGAKTWLITARCKNNKKKRKRALTSMMNLTISWTKNMRR